jgi:hypothetical protein
MLERKIPVEVRAAAHAALDRWLDNAAKVGPDADIGEQVVLKFTGMFSCDLRGRLRPCPRCETDADDEWSFLLGIELSESASM